jgi:hypothetical protein
VTIFIDAIGTLAFEAYELDRGPRSSMERIDFLFLAEASPLAQVEGVGTHRVGTTDDSHVVEEALKPQACPVGMPTRHRFGHLTTLLIESMLEQTFGGLQLGARRPTAAPDRPPVAACAGQAMADSIAVGGLRAA